MGKVNGGIACAGMLLVSKDALQKTCQNRRPVPKFSCRMDTLAVSVFAATGVRDLAAGAERRDFRPGAHTIVHPPSTINACPVVNVDASEAR